MTVPKLPVRPSRRTQLPMQRFERTGLLCVDPRAFFELFIVPPSRENERVDNVEIVDISGPLVQRDELWCDSYESIRERFREACASDARAIVMRIDSPGGDASGCFETARALRAEAAAANKPLFAYIDRSCSAAYALASAASSIAIGETCCAGSIGVLSTRPDYSQQNMMTGLRMAFVTSGQRKLDGNPDVPISDAELAETQRHVDDLAGKFFALIADQRPQLSTATIAGFDGGVFYGEAAVQAGLADAVATFDELLALASKGDTMTLLAKSDFDSARAALEKVAKGSDANAAAAKRALAAMTPPEEDEPEEETEEAAAAEGGEATAEASDSDTEAAATSSETAAASEESTQQASSTAAAAASAEVTLAAKVHRLEAQMAADKEASERKRLMASRPDFGAELKAALAKAPIATVRDMVRTLPKGKVQKRTAPITTVAATRAEGQGTNAPSTRSPEAADLDFRMGLSGPQKLGCRREGTSLIFGVQPAAAEEKPGDKTTPTNGAA